MDDRGSFRGVEREFAHWQANVHDGTLEGEHVAVPLRIEDEHPSNLCGSRIDVDEHLLVGWGR